MTGIHLFKIYCLTLLVFLALDFLWLGLVAKPFYQTVTSVIFLAMR